MRILVISPTFPSQVDPFRGVFVKERIKALAALSDFQVRVIAPVPWFPPVKAIAKWEKWSKFPRHETLEGLSVDRPRYPLPPKVGGYFHSELMYRAVKRTAERIRSEFPFDLIDAHFAYPGGVVAARLGQHFGLPVTITGRGEDMIRFPGLPIVGDRIRWALGRSAACIGVSREIADAMQKNGAAHDRTSVLANGIDNHKFHHRDQIECRRRLNLSEDAKVLLSVGEVIPRKGFDLLIKAMPAVLQEHPQAVLILVGRSGRFGRDVTGELQSLIAQHGLENHVRLAGACPHEELVYWYNAADLFVLMSASEGSPNVLLEALACGTPCIATPVGGIPDELTEPFLGRVLSERTSEAAAKQMIVSLGTDWDRVRIATHMESRSWESVANTFSKILRDACDVSVS